MSTVAKMCFLTSAAALLAGSVWFASTGNVPAGLSFLALAVLAIVFAMMIWSGSDE
jgi:hypothetical protein